MSIKRAEAIFLFYDGDQLVDLDVERGCSFGKEIEIDEENAIWDCSGEQEDDLRRTRNAEFYEISRLSGDFDYSRVTVSTWKLEDPGAGRTPGKPLVERDDRSGTCRPAERAF